jgi:hypothetical protein
VDFEDYARSYDIADERGRRLLGKQAGWPVWNSAGGAVAFCVDDQKSIRIESMDGSTADRSIDVTSDAQKLYAIKQLNPPDGTRINVITNWREQP